MVDIQSVAAEMGEEKKKKIERNYRAKYNAPLLHRAVIIKLVLITNRKSYMSFRLVPKSVTLNDFEWCYYFALFQRIRVASGRTA